MLLALDRGGVIGFASVSRLGKGPNGEYNDLSMFHVDERYRGKGIGKHLFREVVDFARRSNIKKLYISSNSAFETVEFYRSMGCVDAKWIDDEQVKSEPCDYQLEYEIG